MTNIQIFFNTVYEGDYLQRGCTSHSMEQLHYSHKMGLQKEKGIPSQHYAGSRKKAVLLLFIANRPQIINLFQVSSWTLENLYFISPLRETISNPTPYRTQHLRTIQILVFYSSLDVLRKPPETLSVTHFPDNATHEDLERTDI